MNDRFKDLLQRFLLVADQTETQKVLALQIGVHSTTLHNFIAGKKQFYGTLMLIEEYVTRKEREW